MIDHLIITEKGYYSFEDTGLLARIMAETHYDLTFAQIDILKEQMANAEKQSEHKLEIAAGKLKYAEQEARRKLKSKDERLKLKDESLKKKDQKLKKEIEDKNRFKKEVEKLKKLLAGKRKNR